MGQRANYVLIEQGESKIYYTHWGANSIPEMLLAGPEGTWTYVQQATPTDYLLDSVWAEGGVLIDRDRQQLRFWGGEDIRFTPYLRPYLIHLLVALWPGWSVEWAMYGVADLADALHIDRATVLAKSFAEGFDSDRSTSDDELLHSEYEVTLITVRWQDGRVHDYRLPYLPGHSLSLGPHLLDVLRRKQPDSLPYERNDSSDGGFEGGAFFDLATLHMSVWMLTTIDPRSITALSQLWPGWSVSGHVDGIAQQVILSGRDPSSIQVPEDEAIAHLVASLTAGLEETTLSPQNMLAALKTQLPEGTSIQVVAPGFFTTPAPIISTEERRQILRRFFSSQTEE